MSINNMNVRIAYVEENFAYLMQKEAHQIFRYIFSNVQIFLASFKILFPLPSRNKQSNRIPQRKKKR